MRVVDETGREILAGVQANAAAHVEVKSTLVELHVRWPAGAERATQAFVLSLVSHLAQSAESWAVTRTDGARFEDVSLPELLVALRSPDVARLEPVSGCPPLLGWVLRLSADPLEARLTVPVASLAGEREPTDVLWLQSALEPSSPWPLLALPSVGELLHPGALHGLSSLANAVAPVERAEARSTQQSTPIAIWGPRRTGAAHGIAPLGDGLWFPDTAAGADATLFVEALAERATPPALERAWRDQLVAALEQVPPDLAAASALLHQHAPLTVMSLPEVSAPKTGPRPQDALALVAPDAQGVLLGLDLTQPPELLVDATLHALAHVQLGHVRPGDQLGHWDTAAGIRGDGPLRRWDEEVHAAFAPWFRRENRLVSSLAECTPIEKAQLGLWRLAGEMLGQTQHQLHPKAVAYQNAAYQRLAAQRLLAQLEEYGGAMLCDGVGLGKTYVATTLLVHYANAWAGRSPAVDDPFRITILAPSSVVSTWHREALPPLAAHGVKPGSVRVISHSKLSRIMRTSEVLELPDDGGLSDIEHLLLSDLVIVDEAHNFRNESARRTVVLRDLLRNQPRLPERQRRKVLLLTATPVNNSLEDLRQEASLLFSRELRLSENVSEDGYRKDAFKTVRERAVRARRSRKDGSMMPLLVHGDAEAAFSTRIEFRSGLKLGPQVADLNKYLREQDDELHELQESIRAAARTNMPPAQSGPVRIAEDLLDRVVVQRSRALCKDIERQQGSNIELLFRPDAGTPTSLKYDDEYDGTPDVLRHFLPLFDEPANVREGLQPLSLKVYMWSDVRLGLQGPEDVSSVVGLQRILVLKRLESSPVAFLITLLRLTVLHAHRLQDLQRLCAAAGDTAQKTQLQAALRSLVEQFPRKELEKVYALATGGHGAFDPASFVSDLSGAYLNAPELETDDLPKTLPLFAEAAQISAGEREQLQRLWALKDAVLKDFGTLLAVAPQLTDIVFGAFHREEWPRKLINKGTEVDWPRSPAWGHRLVRDPKLRELMKALLDARGRQQKVIVFSQFTDSIAYIQSVMKATESFAKGDWALVLPALGARADALKALFAGLRAITGDTEDRDSEINAFAPYYRLGPFPPSSPSQGQLLSRQNDPALTAWTEGWERAIQNPVDVVLASDVLAEGVNLQDAARLINWDIHWNPVRMIQRAGRIDRRLNPRIEHAREFPAVDAIATRLSRRRPPYYWHGHADEAPVTMNMLLPDELEEELQLRERIASKTLAIDFTLGLEHGTGAEAEWMANYRYQGVSSLNAFQKDRAIEQLASWQEKLQRRFAERGIQKEWASSRGFNVWVRETGVPDTAPLVSWALLGKGAAGEKQLYARALEPAATEDGVSHWLWSVQKPGNELLNFWIRLDGASWPPRVGAKLPWTPTASTPVTASHLVAAAQRLEKTTSFEHPSPVHAARCFKQGATAISAGFFRDESDRLAVHLGELFVLQLSSFTPPVPRRGILRACAECGHAPGMHKCCPQCRLRADGEAAVENLFGFRRMKDAEGGSYDVPQTWCRRCRVAKEPRE